MTRLLVSMVVVGSLLVTSTEAPGEVPESLLFVLAWENGDTNGDWERDLSDPIYLLSHLFLGSPAPVPLLLCGTDEPFIRNGDSNGDGALDVSDPVHLLSWLYSAGAEPAAACGDGSGTSRRGGRRIRTVSPRSGKGVRGGSLYAVRSAEWWRWALSIPAGLGHPLVDETGADCDVGQSGPFWNLGGTFTTTEEDGVVVGVAERECLIPEGKFIHFPILNVFCNTAEEGFPSRDATDQELLECAEFFGNAATDLAAEINGEPVRRIERFRIQSAPFDFDLSPGNLLGAAPGTYRGADDGTYLVLAPPPVGEHDIHFTGTFVFTVAEFGFDFVFRLDITYHLIIVEDDGNGDDDDTMTQRVTAGSTPVKT